MKLEFKILHAKSADDMVRDVNEHLAKGWQLAGGMTTPVYYNYEDEGWYYEFFQPLLRAYQTDSAQPQPVSAGKKKEGAQKGRRIFGPPPSSALEVKLVPEEEVEQDPELRGKVVTGPEDDEMPPTPEP